VQIRVSTHRRLRAYIEDQMPRPSIADVVTIAVEQYLDREERGE